jgi:hypothetical protein
VAGYSGTPLPKKRGIREGDTVAFRRAPDGFADALGALPDGVRVKRRAARPIDVVVAFFTDRAELARRLEALAAAIHPHGALWVAWPKRASGVETDLTEDVARDLALPLGMVDNKVCAIDETWSACAWCTGSRTASRRTAPRPPGARRRWRSRETDALPARRAAMSRAPR